MAGRPGIRCAALAALLLLAACNDPNLTAGISVGPDGVAVMPRVSGTIGGVGVGFTPGTIR